MNQEIPMTLKGKTMLTEELNHLIKVERESIKQALAEARAHGDLKENADYHAAKEKQSHVEGRIMELQSKLARAKVVDVSSIKGDHVVFGATVTLYNTQKDESVTYQLVGEDEAKENGKISYNSPLGKALIGKELGDAVEVRAPKGTVEYEIESVEYK